MDSQEWLRMKKLYESLSDEVLIERAQEGRRAYQEGVYDMILGEVRARRLEGKLRRREPKEESGGSEFQVGWRKAEGREGLHPAEEYGRNEIPGEDETWTFVVIFAGQRRHVRNLQARLEIDGIGTFVKDETYVSKIAVEENDLQRARPIVLNFIEDKEAGRLEEAEDGSTGTEENGDKR